MDPGDNGPGNAGRGWIGYVVVVVVVVVVVLSYNFGSYTVRDGWLVVLPALAEDEPAGEKYEEKEPDFSW